MGGILNVWGCHFAPRGCCVWGASAKREMKVISVFTSGCVWEALHHGRFQSEILYYFRHWGRQQDCLVAGGCCVSFCSLLEGFCAFFVSFIWCESLFFILVDFLGQGRASMHFGPKNGKCGGTRLIIDFIQITFCNKKHPGLDQIRETFR